MLNRAIVVGIQAYPELPPALQGSGSDAKKFLQWATTHGGVDPDPAKEQATLILDGQPPSSKALDARPTADMVKYEFDRLEELANASPNGRAGDRLYLYLSGHGFGHDLSDAALLMANATQARTRHHIPGRQWADHFFATGIFKEVLLFIDCCRERYAMATLNGPGTQMPPMPPPGARRFYGFAAKYGKLAVERPVNGHVGGVFTATLLDGLNGGAAEDDGRITGESLKAYLYENMNSYLSPADLVDKDVAREPDLFCDTPEAQFVIATIPPVAHPVKIPLPPGSGLASRELFGERGGKKYVRIAQSAGDGTAVWELSLYRGTYHLLVNGISKVVTVKGKGAIDVTDP